VAKSAWGKVTPPTESDVAGVPHWSLGHDQLSWTRPILPTADGSDEAPVLTSYNDYLVETYPTKGHANAEQNKAIIQDRLHSFARPGGPGSKFKNTQEKMLKALTLPKGAKEELNFSMEIQDKILNGLPLWEEEEAPKEGEEEEEQDGKKEKKLTDEQKNLMTMFGEGKYHLIPSFFRTLVYLKKQKREFSVCFRTYGKDLDKVVWEFNRFCDGNHPCYSGRNGTPSIKFDGSKGTKDLRIKNFLQKGCFFRYSNLIEDMKFLQGTHDRVSNDFNVISDHMNSDEWEDFEMHQEPINAYMGIMTTLQKCGTMAINEDYENWKENDHHREVAKLLMIDQADYNTQHIFFDDNADEDDDCIVDVRDVITGEIVSNNKFMDRYVVKSEPHRAILEVDYFIKKIEECEQARDNEIERVEGGMIDPADEEREEQPVENEWEKLQNTSNEEYLMRTVLPVLYQGMKVVDQQRPCAPLEYLALYLLKHQDQINLPAKPEQV